MGAQRKRGVDMSPGQGLTGFPSRATHWLPEPSMPQVHRLGDGRVQYYSRKAIEHGEHSSYSVMDAAVVAATGGHERIILDGELIVWNKVR